MEKETEKRIIDLESQIAFMQVTLEDLNQVVTKQQNQIDTLTARLKDLVDQTKTGSVENTAQEKPPHY